MELFVHRLRVALSNGVGEGRNGPVYTSTGTFSYSVVVPMTLGIFGERNGLETILGLRFGIARGGGLDYRRRARRRHDIGHHQMNRKEVSNRVSHHPALPEP